MQTDRYYRHSGRFPAEAAAKALGAGMIAAVPMAFAYAYVITYISIVGTVSFALTMCLVGAMGSVVGWTLKSGKVRNDAVTLGTAGAVGLFTLWISWVAWVYAFLRRSEVDVSLLALALDPATLWRIIGLVNQKGAWSLKSFTPIGTELWILWGIEAAIILGGVAGIAYEWVNKPFCEACERWCEEHKGIAHLGHTDKANIAPRLERGDYAVLGELTPPTELAYTRIDMHQCPECKATTTLTATAVTVRVKNGKHETKESKLLKFLIVAAGDVSGMHLVLDEARARAAAAEEAA